MTRRPTQRERQWWQVCQQLKMAELTVKAAQEARDFIVEGRWVELEALPGIVRVQTALIVMQAPPWVTGEPFEIPESLKSKERPN